MKHLATTCLAVAVFAAGCNNEKSVSEQLEKVKTETKEAAQDMKDYTFAQKAEFVAKMKDQLDALDEDLDQLSAKIENSSDAVKVEATPKLQALREQAAGLNTEMDLAGNATESTWDSVRATSQKSFDSLTKGFQQSRQWLSDQIEP